MTLPVLPNPRGPLTTWLIERLGSRPGAFSDWPEATGDPIHDDDEALALYLCYELHYRGFAGVADEWEWNPSLLQFRSGLEDRFLGAVADEAGLPLFAPSVLSPGQVTAELDAILATPGRSLSRYMAEQGTRAQFEEFAIHRSAYQLKEADPHTWAVPRLGGDAKAALVTIQHDEYGAGDPRAVHSHLFADTLRALGLSDRYGAYLDLLPGISLSTVNLISLFGLHRRWRGALIGHLAVFEMASVGPNTNYAKALRRLGVDEQAVIFHDVHVVADEVHQRIARDDLAGQLAAEEPEVAADIVFGAWAITAVERLFTANMLDAWAEGRSSLRLGGTGGGDWTLPAVPSESYA